MLLYYSGLQIRVRTWILFFLFLNQNICCAYSKEPSQWDGSFEYPKHMVKLMDKKIITILGKLFFALLALWLLNLLLTADKRQKCLTNPCFFISCPQLVIINEHQYIEDIQMFLLNMCFISRVKWTIFIFHEWRSHEWNIIIVHFSSEIKDIFNKNIWNFLFIIYNFKRYRFLYYMTSYTFAQITSYWWWRCIMCHVGKNWNHRSKSRESENFSKSRQFDYQNIPCDLTKKMNTHTLCFCPLIRKLQAFEILKWAKES